MTTAPRAESRERLVRANGIDIGLTEFPNPGAPPLVLLHGIGSRGNSWWPVADPLAECFHLFQFDLRGHGASSRPPAGYDIADYAADLAALLDALELESPRILGHSLGALVTLFWASQHPRRAAALVVEDPPLRTEPEILPAFDGWQQLAALTPAQAAAWYRQEHPDWSDEDCARRAETITSTAPGVFAELRAMAEEALTTGTTDRMPILGEVQSPALLLHGNRELGGMVDPIDAGRFVEVMSRAQELYVPEAGHSIHRDASERFLEAVVPFLAGDTP